MASISRRFWSTSKKPPQVAGALLDVVDVAEGLGGDHGEAAIKPAAGADRKRTRRSPGRFSNSSGAPVLLAFANYES
jgi:hypothetical protein